MKQGVKLAAFESAIAKYAIPVTTIVDPYVIERLAIVIQLNGYLTNAVILNNVRSYQNLKFLPPDEIKKLEEISKSITKGHAELLRNPRIASVLDDFAHSRLPYIEALMQDISAISLITDVIEEHGVMFRSMPWT